MRALLLAGIVAVGCFQNVQAAAVVDQSYLSNNNYGGFSGSVSTYRRAETFTVGVDGILSEIDIFYKDNPIFNGLNILSTSSNTPTTTVVATGSVASQSAGVAKFNLSLNVVVGEVLAIEPIDSAPVGSWLQNIPDTYAGGEDFFIYSAFGINSFRPDGKGDDFTTFVSVSSATTVSEPSSIALLGLSLAGILAQRRRESARRSMPISPVRG